MPPLTISSIDELKEQIGKPIGPSDWVEVTQEDINKFAEVSRDDQWIHVDVERAERESPFGTTVAHGNLTLSLIDGLRLQLISQQGVKMGINYGWNKVRFPAPVPAGSKVRATAEILTVDELGDGWVQVATKFTLEREGGEKPVCVAESVGRALRE
jgi:acyl dehydratase